MSIKDERNDLESMIDYSVDSLEGNVAPSDEAKELKMNPTFDIDFDKARRNCQRRARRMIKNATGLMISDEKMQKDPYLKNKMQVDTISLAGLLYQLEINELMQETLMEEVRSGAAHPRMFEVFGNMSKTIGELNKQLLQTVEAIKMTYKDVKGDIQEKEDLKAIGPGESGIRRDRQGGLISMGTKGLINETKKLKAENAEIISFEEVMEKREESSEAGSN